MIFSELESLVIPEGEVVSIAHGAEILWQKSKLPAEYKEVEYLQSSGTQYINTGFKPNQNTRVVTDAHVLSVDGITGNGLHIASCIGNSKYFTMYIANGAVVGSRFGTQSPLTFSANKPPWNQRQIYDKNKDVTSVSGYSVKANAENFQHDYAIFLFARNNAGTMDMASKSRIYSCKIYDNGTIVRDFVPCYRKSDGKVGMYDIVNGVFYVNKGTGEFLYGGDV